jgi:cobalt/nickel transport system ATP-binding protein
MPDPCLFVVAHGSRSEAGVAEVWRFLDVLRSEAPERHIALGFIELAQPDLDTAIDKVVADGAADVVAVPLVLLGAGHAKNDGPAALDRARSRHEGVRFRYATPLGVHPLVLEVAEERIRDAVAAAGDVDPATVGVIVVGRGSSDPDANSDLAKVARLLQDSRGLDIVEPAFISLAPPSVAAALERCRRLGATTIVTVPYFLFTGILVDRIAEEARAWARQHPELQVVAGEHLGADPRIARLVLERHAEAVDGTSQASCDRCVYRIALPGYEDRVGAPLAGHGHAHDHDHGHR